MVNLFNAINDHDSHINKSRPLRLPTHLPANPGCDHRCLWSKTVNSRPSAVSRSGVWASLTIVANDSSRFAHQILALLEMNS